MKLPVTIIYDGVWELSCIGQDNQVAYTNYATKSSNAMPQEEFNTQYKHYQDNIFIKKGYMYNEFKVTGVDEKYFFRQDLQEVSDMYSMNCNIDKLVIMLNHEHPNASQDELYTGINEILELIKEKF